MDKMPRWADIVLVPLINIFLAFVVAGLVVLAIGQNPFDMVYFMVKGALGSTTGIGYTLYYATNFIFTGLAFSVAMHARHAECQWVLVGERAARHQRGDHEGVRQLGQLAQRLGSAGLEDSSAGVDHGPLGLQERARRFLDHPMVALGVRPVTRQ